MIVIVAPARRRDAAEPAGEDASVPPAMMQRSLITEK
jgi:hypothetical protein